MFKKLLLLLLAFAMMLEPASAAPSAPRAALVGTTVLSPDLAPANLFRRKPRKGRPNYMRYTGGNRTKMKKLTTLRRWKLYRKAKAKRGTHGTPSVKAGAPTRMMKK